MVIELSGVYFDLLSYELITKSVDRDSPFCSIFWLLGLSCCCYGDYIEVSDRFI